MRPTGTGARAFLALGSNVGDSAVLLGRAVRLVREACGGRVTGCSGLYASAPQLVTDQDPFLNAVLEVELPAAAAQDGPAALLSRLKAVEGRFAKSDVRFGPRELDIDIISFGRDERHETPDGFLLLPHPRAHERDFVLRPLCDLPHGSAVRLGPDMRTAGELLAAAREAKADQGTVRLRNSIWSPGKFPWAEALREGGAARQRRTMVMGILNVTPDSFSDGGQFLDTEAAVARALEMCAQGADVVDVGGESTRPFAEPVGEQEEMDRVLPVVERLAREPAFTASLSIDTRKSAVARAAVAAGAHIINDEVGEEDDARQAMLEAAGELCVPIVTMHARGDAQTMEGMVLDGEDFDVVRYVGSWLERRAAAALEEHDVASWNVMLDPGLGFAKTGAQNLALLRRLGELPALPVLVGASRKRFVRELSETDIDVATSATSAAAALEGAAMVRVHNVAAAAETLRVVDAIKEAGC